MEMFLLLFFYSTYPYDDLIYGISSTFFKLMPARLAFQIKAAGKRANQRPGFKHHFDVRFSMFYKMDFFHSISVVEKRLYLGEGNANF